MDLGGKLAFITGAGSGIGYAIAQKCAEQGMSLAITDINQDALDAAAASLAQTGAPVRAWRLDVSDLEAYRRVSQSVLTELGVPYLLANNAGVAWKAPAATATPEDWRWLVSVNVLGVGYGLSLFAPRMIEAGQGGYVLNTGSITGLITSPGTSAVYAMTKHAVVAISETLAHELRPHGIGVAVLCPGSVATAIADADRNLAGGVAAAALSAAEEAERAFTRDFVSKGLKPSAVVDAAFAALAEGRFYVVTHPEYRDEIETRHRQIEGAVHGEPASDVGLLEMARAVLALQPLT
ncbi:MAG: SDR family NAD(P)-dependent oxidoreductase [Caulobacteraceae bacterium]|nr:SDR family NAD(P)-dependent oxidoreductase [Caulobacteraceae bacterium]